MSFKHFYDVNTIQKFKKCEGRLTEGEEREKVTRTQETNSLIGPIFSYFIEKQMNIRFVKTGI